MTGRSFPSAVPRIAGLLALAWAAVVGPAAAEEVRTRARGLTLNANLELADGKGLEDGVVLITHGLLAHNRMELIAALQRTLKERGVSTLAINLSLGVDDRRGFFDCGRLQAHRPGDALDEIEAWIGWLKAQGAAEIVLMGHSLGGAQTARYVAERDTGAVAGVVLLAPAVYDRARFEAIYRERYAMELAPLVARAKALLREGRGHERIDRIGFLTCENATATAESIVAWYDSADAQTRHTPALLPRLEARTLVIVGTADEVLPDLVAQMRPFDGRNRITVKAIEGADHFFRDLYAEDAADLIAQWLGR